MAGEPKPKRIADSSALLLSSVLLCLLGVAAAVPMNATHIAIIDNWISQWEVPLRVEIWNATKIAETCPICPSNGNAWFGICCNEFGDLQSMYFINESITTTFPNEVAQIETLKQVRALHCKLYGTIPVDLFSARITALNLVGNNFWGPIGTPSSIKTTPFDVFELNDNLISGPIPNWLIQAGGKSMRLDRNMLTCPLTQSQLDTLCRFTTISGYCSLRMNLFSLEAGGFCGSPLVHLAGSNLGTLIPQPPVRLIPFSPNPKFAIDATNHLRLEFDGTRIFFFSVHSNGTVEREQYTWLEFPSLLEDDISNVDGAYSQLIPFHGFDTMVEISPKVYRLTANLYGGCKFVLDFDFVRPTDYSSVKISYQITDFPWFKQGTKMMLPVYLGIRVPHSNSTTQLRCDVLTDDCHSGLMNVDTARDLFASSVEIIATKIKVSYSQAIDYILDDTRLRYFKAFGARSMAIPFGPARILNEVYDIPGAPFKAMLQEYEQLEPSLRGQAFVQTIQLEIDRFNKSFFLDPTMQLNLLFDSTPSTPPQESSDIVIGAAVGGSLAAIIVLTVIALVAFVPSIRYKVLPFKLIRKAPSSVSLVEVDEPGSTNSTPRNTWVSGRPTLQP